MPTINYTFVSRCGGGCHVVMDVAVDGGNPRRVVWDIDDIRGALANKTPESREILAREILGVRLHGLTRAEITNAFQAGAGTLSVEIG